MTTAKDVMKLIKDNDVKYADFRFTDPRGKWQHVTFDVCCPIGVSRIQSVISSRHSSASRCSLRS